MMEKRKYLQDIKIDKQTRALMNLLVYEIHEANSSNLEPRQKVDEIKRILDGWVKGCHLEPGKVKRIPAKVVDEYIRGKVGFDGFLKSLEEVK